MLQVKLLHMCQGVCVRKQLTHQTSNQVAQTLASSALACRACGTMSKMPTSATLSSDLTVFSEYIGPVQSAQTGIHTNGKLVLLTCLKAMAALSAPAMLCAHITPLVAKPHTLSQSGTQQRILSHHMTTRQGAVTVPIGNVIKVINGKRKSLHVLETSQAALSVSRLDPDRAFRS